MSTDIKQKDDTEKNSKLSYLRFGESYTSLILGIIVVIFGTLLLLSIAHNRNVNKVDEVKSNVPEGITEITQTNMETVIRSVRLSPTASPMPTATSTPKAPIVKKSVNSTDKKTVITKNPTPAPTKISNEPAVAPSKQASNTETIEKNYITQSGDTLWSIAESNYKSGYNWVDIARANKLSNPDSINIGARLVLPNVDQKNASSEPDWKDLNSLTTSGINGAEKITGNTYLVKNGDNLWNISVRAYGDGYKWVELARSNNLSNPNLIYPGNSLRLPGK